MAHWTLAQQQEATALAAAAGIEFHEFEMTGTAYRPVTIVWASPYTTENQRKIDALIARLDDKFTEENDAQSR